MWDVIRLYWDFNSRIPCLRKLCRVQRAWRSCYSKGSHVWRTIQVQRVYACLQRRVKQTGVDWASSVPFAESCGCRPDQYERAASARVRPVLHASRSCSRASSRDPCASVDEVPQVPTDLQAQETVGGLRCVLVLSVSSLETKGIQINQFNKKYYKCLVVNFWWIVIYYFTAFFLVYKRGLLYKFMNLYGDSAIVNIPISIPRYFYF